jgi:hypothetical protein
MDSRRLGDVALTCDDGGILAAPLAFRNRPVAFVQFRDKIGPIQQMH